MWIFTKATHKIDQKRCQNAPGGLFNESTVQNLEKLFHRLRYERQKFATKSKSEFRRVFYSFRTKKILISIHIWMMLSPGKL